MVIQSKDHLKDIDKERKEQRHNLHNKPPAIRTEIEQKEMQIQQKIDTLQTRLQVATVKDKEEGSAISKNLGSFQSTWFW